MKDKPIDVFFCYSRTDCNLVRHCNNLLQKMNVTSFVDSDYLIPGTDFAETIQRNIVNCRIIVFVISENSKRSEWALNEIRFAQNLGKTIVPILVDNTSFDERLSLLLGYNQHVKWNPNDISVFDDEFVKTIKYHIERFREEKDISVRREIDLDSEIKILDEYQPRKIDFDIFISYRRVGGRDIARSIKYRLEMMGFNKVFFDYNSIRDGMFNTQILDAIYSCNDFLLLLSPDAMEKCGDRGDWVAREIRTAKKFNRKIIPISLDSNFIWPVSMPSDLGDIKYIQRHNLLMNEDFEYSIEKLSKRFLSKSSKSDNGPLIMYYKILTNKDCKLYIDGDDFYILKADVIKRIALANRGEYFVEFYDLDTDEKLLQKIVLIEQDKVDIIEF